MGEGAADETLPDPRGPDQNHVVVLGDPAAGGELAGDGLVELTAGRVVDGLDAGVRELELGLLQRPRQPLVLAGEPLGLDEQTETFIEPRSEATLGDRD
jgi:hypothetical protein